MKIDGKLIAQELLKDLSKRVKKLKNKKITPHLYIITFGKNPQTQSYLKQKLLKATQIGAKITIKKFSLNTPHEKIYKLIDELNSDKKVHGIIVQRPLIKNLSEEKISFSILPEKDVDGFNSHSKFSSPVALAVLKLIESAIDNQNILEFLKSKKIAVLGKGITAGLPINNLLKKYKIKFKTIDSKTKKKEKILKQSDIIVSAVGKKIIKKDLIKKGVYLIGVGMHTVDGKLKGDYNEEKIKNKASFYTPTPGGVGPLNVSMLMKNLIDAAENQSLV